MGLINRIRIALGLMSTDTIIRSFDTQRQALEMVSEKQRRLASEKQAMADMLSAMSRKHQSEGERATRISTRFREFMS